MNVKMCESEPFACRIYVSRSKANGAFAANKVVFLGGFNEHGQIEIGETFVG